MAAYTVATYKPIDRIGLNQEIGTTSATQLHDLGERVVAKDTASTSNRGVAEFIYLKGVASTVAGTPVLIKDDYTTSLIAARDKGAHAIATAAIVANNYGWYQIKGVAMVAVGTVVANAPLYIAAGGATYDDAVAVGDLVLGCRSQTATDTGTCLAMLACNPASGDFDNA